MNLRKLRVVVAALMLVAATLLFLDFTGTAHRFLGWVAKVQLLPAVLAVNVGVVAVLVVLTLLFGRLYCSVICPLGLLQDLFARLGRKAKRNRYAYSPAKQVLRYGFLAAFVVLMVAGVGQIAAWIAPYSAFGRIVSTLFAPLWQLANNGLAWLAERGGSYAFYTVEIWWKGAALVGLSAVTFIVVAVLAWRNGRTWCNTVCPVGTVLGLLSRYSWLRPVIDTEKCNGCGLCARNCKAACINQKTHEIDLSRCVVCFDCIDSCKQGAVSYAPRKRATKVIAKSENTDSSRRQFLTVAALMAGTAAAEAKRQKVDGGLAVIVDKKNPVRKTPIVPAGAGSWKRFTQHCTACQLCVTACPNGVLRPSGGVMTLLQPEMGYEKGYCRPECTKCAEVCPTGAIRPITREEKSSEQIGRAVWVKENCLPATEGVKCDNCARHCPTGAIQMIEKDGKRIPSIDTTKCIGCGACEHLCPSRPFSAIYVEGNLQHETL